MKNKTTTLAVLALLGVSMVLAGCPRHIYPHVPHPHRLPHSLLSMDAVRSNQGPGRRAFSFMPCASTLTHTALHL